jgi:hypothetical protein
MPQFVTNAIAALIGTLAAGAIGFFFAVRRFRHEKAFEHRLAWHENTVRKLTEASQTLRRAAVSMQVPELEDDLPRELDEALAAMPNVALLLEAEMYASRKSYKALKQAWHDQSELILANVQIHNTGAALENSDAADRISPKIIEAVAKSMLHAASRLASDVRETLRLGSLDEDGRLYDNDQVAALAGRTDITALDRAKRIRAHKDFP